MKTPQSMEQQRHLRHQKRFHINRKDALLLLVYVLFASLTYELINRPFGTVHSLLLPLDFQIPMVKELILVYHLYFPMIILTALLTYQEDRPRFRRYLITLFLTQLSAYVIYFFYQTEVPVYDTSHMGNDIFTRILRLTYSVDARYAAAPSLHVCNMVVSTWYFSRLGSGFSPVTTSPARPQMGAPRVLPFWLKALAMGLMLLIAASTVLVKQHVIADVPLGFLHAVFWMGAVGLLARKLARR